MSERLIDTDTIQTLAKILTETGLTEIEVAEKDSRIRVVRKLDPLPPVTALPHSVTVSPSPIGQVADQSTIKTQQIEDLSAHPGAVTSPMVGVVYLTPSPTSPPFVTEGQSISAGQTIMLIEAMKTFNPIKAPKGGTLKSFLVNSGEPVEFGQTLAIIE